MHLLVCPLPNFGARAEENLKKAEALIEEMKEKNQTETPDFSKLYSLTMNNLGCYYKKMYKPNVALKYMQWALMNDINSKQPKSHLSSTKLNICAILS